MGGTPIRSEVGTYPNYSSYPFVRSNELQDFGCSPRSLQIATSRNAVKRAIIYHRRQAFFGVLRSREGSIRSLLAEAGFWSGRSVVRGSTYHSRTAVLTDYWLACYAVRCFATPKNQVLSILGKPSWKHGERDDGQREELNWSRTSSLKRSHISDVISINFTRKDAKHDHWLRIQHLAKRECTTGHRRTATSTTTLTNEPES